MIERFVSILNEAINMLYINDQCLIDRGGMEQACVSRIYFYLQTLINLDIELKTYIDVFSALRKNIKNIQKTSK